MSHDPLHDPQRHQAQDPYSFHNPYPPYNPSDPQESQPTFVSPPSYAPEQVQQLYPSQQPPAPYASGTRSEQSREEAGRGQKLPAQIWHGLVQLLGVRGVVMASGAVLAALAFVVLPYYSIYSGYFLAAQTLDEKWWLELILAVLPLDLNFSLLEVAMFGLVTGLYALISLDGESTWLEGLQLCAF